MSSHLLMLDNLKKKKNIYIKITFDPLQCYHRKKNIYIYIKCNSGMSKIIYNAMVE